MAPDARQWREVLSSFSEGGDEDPGCSLSELFSLFAEDRLYDLGRNLNVMEMRLLLHPLHALVSNYSQITASLNVRSKRNQNRPDKIRPSHSQTFDEIHSLCRRWLIIFETIDIQGARLTVVARATLVQYHLISINLLCSFKTFESFSRREGPENVVNFACSVQETLGVHLPELLAHCGQILRLVRSSDVKLRPPWWSVAVYRAGLVLWVCSITRKYFLRRTGQGQLNSSGPPVVLDGAAGLFDPALSRYLLSGVGRPCLTCPTDSESLVYVDHPRSVLQVCIEAFGRGLRLWRLTRGLQCKMETLYGDWDEIHSELER